MEALEYYERQHEQQYYEQQQQQYETADMHSMGYPPAASPQAAFQQVA